MLRVKHASPAEYRLPDGSPLSIGPTDLFRCTEPLFQPEIAGLMQSGMANLITESLQRYRQHIHVNVFACFYKAKCVIINVSLQSCGQNQIYKCTK